MKSRKRKPGPRTSKPKKGSKRSGHDDALRESQKFLRQIIDLVPHFVFAKDEQSRFLLMNKAVADAYGTTAEEAIGKTDSDFSATPDEARHFHEDDLAVIRDGKPRTVPAEPITDSEGHVRFLQTTKIPFLFGPEKTPSILGVAVDITDLKHSERQIQESEEKYRNLVERAHDGIAVLQDGIVRYVNPVLAGLFGGTIPEILGTDFTRYVHPDEVRKLADNYLRRLTDQSSPSTYETVLLDSRGHAIPVEVNAGAIQYDGRIADLVIIRDTRERRKGEDAVARRDAILKIVRDAAEQFLKSPDPESTINDVLMRLGRVMRVDHTYIYEKTKAQGGTILVRRRFSWTSEAHGRGRTDGESPTRLSETMQCPRWHDVLGRGDVMYGNTEDFPPDERAPLHAAGVHSILAIPIFAGKTWWGFIGCDDCSSPREWSLLETDALGSLASILGAVMQRRKTERVQHAVYRIAQATGSTSGIDELCGSIHRILAEIMEAGNFYVALYDRTRDLLSFPFFVDEFDPPPAPKRPGRGLTEYVLRSGTSLLCTDDRFTELIERGEAELIGKPSPVWLGVPLVVDREVIGVMVLQHYSDPGAYGEEEKQVLEYVSSQIARAIDKKRADEALVSQTAYFQRLFEDGPAGIALMDTSDRIVRVNKSFQLMFGYTAEEILGRNINDIIVPPDLAEEGNEMSALTQGGKTVSKETVRKRRDGTTIDVNITGYPILIEGKHVGVYGMYENVSERKALEAQVLHSQKMESIGTLAGGIAHDFNNLLAIILGHASLLEKSAADPSRYSSSLQSITRAAERASGVVRQLLTFARKTDRRKESVRINDVIRELLKFLAETLPKSITLSTELAEELPSVIGDASQLHQVLMNICVNARDAMPQGGTLSLRTRVAGIDVVRRKFAGADVPVYVEIRASDTGLGMDEKVRRRIFEPFFSTKAPGQGTGLGLAVVFGIIESNRGFIDVESAPGRGSTFTIYLPVPSAAVPEAAPAVKETEEPPRGTESILIVEDEEPLSELLQLGLETAGYKVLTAAEGDAALDMFRSHRDEISLVISDVGLPKLSGDQLFRAMKKVDPAVKTVLASGYIEPALKAQAKRDGVKAFIQKPYEMKAVLKEVRQILDEE